VEHDCDGADGASPFRLRTGTECGDLEVNTRKSVLPSFSRETTATKSRRAKKSQRMKEPSRRDVSASFSNGQDHAERVDGPAISDGRQREKKEKEKKEERSRRMLQYIGGCMKSDVEKQEQESDAFARGREEKEGERERAQHVSGI